MNPDDFNLGMTQNEIQIIKCLRSLKPFENVTISADNNGMYDTYIVFRSTQVMMKHDLPPVHMKAKVR